MDCDMSLVENRILGFQLDEAGQEVILSLIDTNGLKFALYLHGVEQLLISEVRQQNVIEELTHWVGETETPELREAAFMLLTGTQEKECPVDLAIVACKAIDRVVRGEIEMIEIKAIYGAQLLALFNSMEIERPLEA